MDAPCDVLTRDFADNSVLCVKGIDAETLDLFFDLLKPVLEITILGLWWQTWYLRRIKPLW